MMTDNMSETFHTHAHKPPHPGPASPDAPKKKIKLPPYTGLRPASRERHKVPPPWVTIGLTVLGFAAIAAFFADMYGFTRKATAVAPVAKAPADLMLAVTTATNRYTDPLGRFTIATPPGWKAWFGTTNVEYDALLEGPDRLALQVVIGDAPGETIDNLKKTFADMEQEQGHDMHITNATFHGAPAISRFTRMDLVALRALDFMATTNTEIHLMGLIPREKYETHFPVIDALMETLQPAKVP